MGSRVGSGGWLAADYIQDDSGHDVALVNVKLSAAKGPILGSSATATTTQVAAATANTQLLAANANRLGATIYYDGPATLYLLEGTGTPSSTNWSYKLGAGGQTYYLAESPGGVFTGVIKGIWSAASGSANVTERTA